MAWVTQKFEAAIISAILAAEFVEVRAKASPGSQPLGSDTGALLLKPSTSEEAHHAAMVLRRAARRLEEIGKGLA